MKTLTTARFVTSVCAAFLFTLALMFSQTAYAVSLPAGSSAVIQNSNSSTVEIAITGSNFDRFYNSGTSTADSTDTADLLHIHYNGNTPVSATMAGSVITAIFPISAGSYKSGGALTIAANTLANGTLAHNTSTLSVANGSITDHAKPVVVVSDIDGAALDGSNSSPQTVQVTFSEPISNTPTISVSPDGDAQDVNNCSDANAATWCFDYAIPAHTTATETITISGANDTATSPNTMDSDDGHAFTVSPYEDMVDIVGDMVNADGTHVEIVVPSSGPTLTGFWYSGSVNANSDDSADLSRITYDGVHPTSAAIDTENNAIDLFFSLNDVTTAPEGDLDILEGTVVASGGVGNAEGFVPQANITDDAAPVLVSGYAQNSGGSSPTTQVIFTMSENLVDVDNGTVNHPNFTIKNATTGQAITVTAADISGGGDNSFYLNLDTTDPDDYDGPLTFSYDTGAEGTQMLDYANPPNYTTNITDFPVTEANGGYCSGDCGGGGGGGGSTVGYVKVTVTDVTGTPISGADVQMACPAWSSFQDAGTTNGSGVIEFDPTTLSGCSSGVPVSFTASKSGYIDEQTGWVGAFDPSGDPEATNVNRYAVHLVANFDGTGSGSPEDPYMISTCSQLQSIQGNLGSAYKLAGDIDCSGDYFNPIGWDSYFYGSLDGDHYTISNVTIDEPNIENVGIFDEASDATFENLTLDTINVTGEDEVGSLVGYIDHGATLSNITATNTTVTSTDGDDTGGLVGYGDIYDNQPHSFSGLSFSGTVTGDYWDNGGLFGYLDVYNANTSVSLSNASVSGTISGYGSTGGFVGDLEIDGSSGDGSPATVTITNATMSAAITDLGGDSGIGGLLGYVELDGDGGPSHLAISGSTVSGSVSGNSNTGGIIGEIQEYDDGSETSAVLDNDTMTNNVTAPSGGYSVGGLVGTAYIFNNGYSPTMSITIENSSMTGNVTGDSFLGGILGGTAGMGPGVQFSGSSTGGVILQNDFSTGNVTSINNGDNIGGVAGFLACASSSSGLVHSCQVKESYATGDIGGNQNVGGLVGIMWGDVALRNTYATGTVTGQSQVGGLVGAMDSENDDSLVSNSYASGILEATGESPSNFGGLVGGATQSSGTARIEHSFSATDMGNLDLDIRGWLVGDLENFTPTDSWYAPVPSEHVNACYGNTGDTTGCTAADGTATFINQTSGGPFGAWNFPTVWTAGVARYPLLTGTDDGLDDTGGTPASPIDSGSGTPSDPYHISTCSGIEAMNDHRSSSFLLTADADCSGDTNAVMVGTDSGPFTGTFDGGGHTVTISLNQSEYSIGLFRRADGATITNVLLAGSVQGFSSVGALVGWASNTTISYVGSSANVSTGGAGNLGGLVGIDTAGSTISNSYNTGNVTGGDDAGGILGQGNYSTIQNSYASGTISGGTNVGGLIGRISNGGRVAESFGAAIVNGSAGLGALIGESNSVTTHNNYFDADRSTLGNVCYGDQVNDPQCQAENQEGGDPTYFKNNSDSSPLNDWDFINVWTTTSEYPVFGNPIHVVPSKVLNLTHTSEDAGSVNLSWDAPMYNIDAVTDYVIEYSEHDANSWSTFTHDPFTSTTISVTGLSSGTDYDFRVSAVNGIGTGLASDTTEDTTSGSGGGNSFAGGDGSLGNPYQIASCGALAEVNGDLTAHYVLNMTLDCSTAGNGAMIGSSASPFTGTFNGQGYTITVSIDDPIHDVGLFGATDGATIANVRLAGSVTAVGDVGALVGYADNHTAISFVGSIANVTDSSVGGDAGGLVGQLIGGSSISNSYSRGTVSSGGSAVGGLVGYMNTGASVDRSYAVGSVAGSTSGSVGGLVGYNFEPTDSISNSFSAGAVMGSGTTVAGFFGYTNGATLTNDYFDGNRSGQVHCAGYNGDQCTAVNSDGMNSTYFLNTSSSAPLDSWDFTNIWVTTDDYPALRSDAHSLALSVSVTTPADGSVALSNNWHPVVDWGTATTCQYAYGSGSYQTVTCSNNGSDIPAPTGSDFADATLHIKGSEAGQADATKSSTFFYYQTAQTTPAGGPNFTWNHQAGWSGGIALHMARSADGSKVATVPDIGDVQTSTDGGVSWTDQTVLGNHQWNSVAMSATGQYILASIYGGDTYLSSDGGSNWTDIETLGGPGLMSSGASVAMSADGQTLYVAGNGYDLYSSKDFGSSWQLHDTGITGWGNLASSADGKYLVALNDGELYISSDYGRNFSAASGVPVGNLNALGLSADGSTIAVGGWHGDVGISRDFGSTWTDETALGDHFWYGFGLSADGSVIATGVNYDSDTNTGPMYISTDGGNTFTQQTNGVGNDNWQSFGVSADGTQVLAFGNQSGLNSLGSSGGGGGGGGGTTGFIKVHVTDLAGNSLADATVTAACPGWNGVFNALGTTDGSGILEVDPRIADTGCQGGQPINIRASADGYITGDGDSDWSSYSTDVDPENEIGDSTDNQYRVSLIPHFDGTGSGTSPEDPYIITNCNQLEGIQDNLSAYYRLNAPSDTIDCSGYDFQPIGEGSNNGFTGNLEGRGLDSNLVTTIENVTINQPYIGDIGLFGYTGDGAIIKNINLSNGSVTGEWDVGSLVGYADMDLFLDNISSNFSIQATDDGYEGGLIGETDFYNGTSSVLSNLTYTGTIDIPNESDIGGIVGYLGVYDPGTVVTMNNDTVSGGEIGATTGNTSDVGGLIGYLDLGGGSSGTTAITIDSANVSSAVSVASGYYIGGLIGGMESGADEGGLGAITVTNSTTSGSVSGDGAVGGFVGSMGLFNGSGDETMLLTGDSATGRVTGTQWDTGGFVGNVSIYNPNPTLARITISDSHTSNTSRVSGESNVGGFIGGVDTEGPGINLADSNATGGLILTNDYSTSNVRGNANDDGAQNAGGFIGYMSCQSANPAIPYACSIASSYATGNATSYQNVGGFIGQMEGDAKIQDVYAQGNVSANAEAGGLIGYANQDASHMLIDRTYASGAITAAGDGAQNAGGLVGQFSTNGGVTFENSFSATDLSAATSATNAGWLVGDLSSVTPSNLWYATVFDGELPCAGSTGDESFCTSESAGSFFQNSTTNGPLANWDFETPIWVDHSTDYPTLSGTVAPDEDTSTQAPTLTSPASDQTYPDASPLDITFTLPEDMQSGSLEAIFTPAEGSPITIHLTDAESGGPNTKTITPSGGIQTASDVVSASADSIPDGTYTVTLSYQDAHGNTPATASSTSVVIAPVSEGAAPTVVSTTPADGAVNQSTAVPVVVTFSEPMDTTTVNVSVESSAPCGPTGCLVDTSWNDDHTVLTITKKPGSFALETSYTFTITGNSAGEVAMVDPYATTFTTVATMPVLTEVTPIPATVTAGNATYHFSVSDGIDSAIHDESGEYQFTAISGVHGHDVSVLMNPTTHVVSFTGLQPGDTPETSFSFMYTPDGAQSNTLQIGPFTVIADPVASGGGGGSSGGTTAQSASVGGCPAGYICIPSTGTAGTGNQGTGGSSGGAYHFPRTLKQDVKPGADVKILQQFLNSHGFPIAKSGTGSKGHETKTFGPATKTALMKFQKANKITPANGILGPKTKAAIEKMMNK